MTGSSVSIVITGYTKTKVQIQVTVVFECSISGTTGMGFAYWEKKNTPAINCRGVKFQSGQTEWGCLLKGVTTCRKNEFSLIRERE
jgi:hypothetical protein